jgi:hypothetical protein
MSSYVKPQVLVFQEFRILPTEITEPLRAHVAGPHGVLHRYSDADEKQDSLLGAYDRLNDTCYAWPQRLAGSRVDMPYTKVYIDDALLQYYKHDIGIGSTVVTAVESRSNWIQASDLSFKSNGAAYPRSSVFADRDVQLGDVVRVRIVSADNDCDETVIDTTVVGFASEQVSSRILPATADTSNQDNVAATSSIVDLTPVSLQNSLSATILVGENGTGYDGLAAGVVEEVYTVEVTKSTVAGCSAARLRVVSDSGTDDVAELQPNAVDDATGETPIGTRGLTVRFSADGTDTFVVGQKWRFVVTQQYEEVVAVSDAASINSVEASVTGAGNDILGQYAGDKNDTYVIECTRGGTWANLPEITVRTVKGLDFSGPTEVTGDGTTVSVAIGTNGVKVKFFGTAGSGDAVAGLRKGDKWYISCVSSAAGPVRRLILRDDLPADVLSAEDMDLTLFIKDNIQVSENRVGFAPMTNYWTEDTQICIQEGIIAYHPEWTAGGVEQPLNVISGKVYVEYREWVAELADQVNSISGVADLDVIRGQLHPDNPLKWGVYKALSNSNGTVVKYTAVVEPEDLNSWVQVLERIKGRDDMYNLVPLTFNKQVHNLWAAHIGGESNEYANNWKAGFFALPSVPVVKVVGEGVTVAGVAGNVVTDPVLATLSDDPNATNTQYTKLQVTSGNGYFVTNDVRPGDIVRYAYTVDGFGDETYAEYVVDEVQSESTLLLYSGADAPVTVSQRVEIYHNRNRNEIAEDIAQQAGALANRRVVGVWPDQVGEAGTLQPGYYLAAALAGLVSGVVPHQPLTNVEVAGFDDYSRSYKYFNETQLNRMAEAGVWIVTEDRDGTPHTRHALTTDNLDLNRREEMIRRNVDSMSYLFLRRLRPFIGRTNAQDGMVRRLRYEVTAVIDFLKANGFTEELGSQLIDGAIRTLQIHPLLKDRIEIVLDLTVPAPLNNIELHLVV